MIFISPSNKLKCKWFPIIAHSMKHSKFYRFLRVFLLFLVCVFREQIQNRPKVFSASLHFCLSVSFSILRSTFRNFRRSWRNCMFDELQFLSFGFLFLFRNVETFIKIGMPMSFCFNTRNRWYMCVLSMLPIQLDWERDRSREKRKTRQSFSFDNLSVRWML